MEKTPAARFRPTRIACYLGYITQSIAINLLSLLYVTLQRGYGITLEQISLLITVCFVVQIAVDLIATRSGERLNYRFGTVAANAAVAAGLVALGILPRVMPVPYVGVVIAVVHRFNDVEDKWVAAEKTGVYTAEEILKILDFQEKYYESELIL